MEHQLLKSNILSLKNGESYIVPEGDYGKAEIRNLNGHYFLYSIPLFGGEYVFEGEFESY